MVEVESKLQSLIIQIITATIIEHLLHDRNFTIIYLISKHIYKKGTCYKGTTHLILLNWTLLYNHTKIKKQKITYTKHLLKYSISFLQQLNEVVILILIFYMRNLSQRCKHVQDYPAYKFQRGVWNISLNLQSSCHTFTFKNLTVI